MTFIATLITACTTDPYARTVAVHNSQLPQHTPQPYEYWHKEGATKRSINDKIGHCRIEIDAQNLSEERADKLVSYCMQSDNYHLMKGWR